MKSLHSIVGNAVSSLTTNEKLAIASIKHDFPNHRFRVSGGRVEISGDGMYWDRLLNDTIEYWSRPLRTRDIFDPAWVEVI